MQKIFWKEILNDELKTSLPTEEAAIQHLLDLYERNYTPTELVRLLNNRVTVFTLRKHLKRLRGSLKRRRNNVKRVFKVKALDPPKEKKIPKIAVYRKEEDPYMKCFYDHTDYDGICSAAIVAKAYPQMQMIPFYYDQHFPLDTINRLDLIFIVDVSIPPEALHNMCRIATVVWIDHHKSAIDTWNKYAQGRPIHVEGPRSITYAACQLTWNYLFPREPMPLGVDLLGWYDTWKHDRHELVLPFQYGMRTLQVQDPRAPFWRRLLDSQMPKTYLDKNVERIAGRGKVAMDYLDFERAQLVKHAHLISIAGYTAIAVNAPHHNALIFDTKDERLQKLRKEASFGVVYQHRGLDYKVSLYSISGVKCPDLGSIAEKWGGGGHPGAAGFYSDYLPWTIKKEK